MWEKTLKLEQQPSFATICSGWTCTSSLSSPFLFTLFSHFHSTLMTYFSSLIPHTMFFLLLLPPSRAVVHIQVDDVNEFSPIFRESLYKASITEGKIYDSILQVSVIYVFIIDLLLKLKWQINKLRWSNNAIITMLLFVFLLAGNIWRTWIKLYVAC